MHRASILVLCALLGACAGRLPEMRPSSSGFAGGGSVLHPLEDGKHHLAAGRNGLAIRRFGEELGRHPRSLDALNGIAVAYARLGRHDVAHTYFERALELDPRDAATLNNYGRSLVEQGRFRDARPFLEQALRYAGDEDVQVIATNMLNIRHAPPPSVLAALRNEAETQLAPRLVRVAADRYHLRTAIMPAAGPPAAVGIVDRGMVPLPAGEVTVAELAQPKPGAAAEEQPLRVALRAGPPLPRARPAPVPAAQPMPASPDRLATIRRVIERRITGTGFEELLHDIFAEPAAGTALPAIEEEIWT